jgi:hypothetical protein
MQDNPDLIPIFIPWSARTVRALKRSEQAYAQLREAKSALRAARSEETREYREETVRVLDQRAYALGEKARVAMDHDIKHDPEVAKRWLWEQWRREDTMREAERIKDEARDKAGDGAKAEKATPPVKLCSLRIPKPLPPSPR